MTCLRFKEKIRSLYFFDVLCDTLDSNCAGSLNDIMDIDRIRLTQSKYKLDY